MDGDLNGKATNSKPYLIRDSNKNAFQKGGLRGAIRMIKRGGTIPGSDSGN